MRSSCREVGGANYQLRSCPVIAKSQSGICPFTAKPVSCCHREREFRGANGANRAPGTIRTSAQQVPVAAYLGMSTKGLAVFILTPIDSNWNLAEATTSSFAVSWELKAWFDSHTGHHTSLLVFI